MIFLIPTFLSESAIETIPAYVLSAIKNCSVIFAENQRTARRFLKAMYKEIIIDHFEWYTIHKTEQYHLDIFINKIKEERNIAIISEAGCPGIADPGQVLVEQAQKIDKLIVHWPSGRVQTLENLTVDRVLTIEEPR